MANSKQGNGVGSIKTTAAPKSMATKPTLVFTPKTKQTLVFTKNINPPKTLNSLYAANGGNKKST